MRRNAINLIPKVLLAGAWAWISTNPALAGPRTDPTTIPPEWLAAQNGPNSPVEATSDLSGKSGDAIAGISDNAGSGVYVIGKARRFAIVNGQVIKKGDLLNGSKVLSITSGEIMMEDATRARKAYGTVEKTINRQPAREKK